MSLSIILLLSLYFTSVGSSFSQCSSFSSSFLHSIQLDSNSYVLIIWILLCALRCDVLSNCRRRAVQALQADGFRPVWEILFNGKWITDYNVKSTARARTEELGWKLSKSKKYDCSVSQWLYIHRAESENVITVTYSSIHQCASVHGPFTIVGQHDHNCEAHWSTKPI